MASADVQDRKRARLNASTKTRDNGDSVCSSGDGAWTQCITRRLGWHQFDTVLRLSNEPGRSQDSERSTTKPVPLDHPIQPGTSDSQFPSGSSFVTAESVQYRLDVARLGFRQGIPF